MADYGKDADHLNELLEKSKREPDTWLLARLVWDLTVIVVDLLREKEATRVRDN